MPLPVEVEKAIADEKEKRGLGDHRDLAEMFEIEKQKEAEEKKEDDKPKKTTKDDADKVATLLGQRLGFRPKEEKKKEEEPKDEKKKDDAGKTDKDVKEPKPKAEAEPGKEDTEPDGEVAAQAEEEKPKKRVVKKIEIDPIEIATAAATRTAENILAAQPKVASKDAPAIEESLSEEERGEYQVFQEMAKAPQHKDLPRQYINYLKRAEDYQRNWEKDNTGKEFNPEDADHDAFYRKHQPKYPELEYKKAISRITSRETESKEITELREEQRRLKAEVAKRELEPVISQTQIGAVGEIIKTIDPKILEDINKVGFAKYAEENPSEGDLIRNIAASIGPFISALIEIDDEQGRIPISKDNKAHKEWAEYLHEKEAEFRKKPLKDRRDEAGRIIVSRSEYARMGDAQREQYTYLDTVMLLNLRVQEEAERAQEVYERERKKLEAVAKRLGWAPPLEKKAENGTQEAEVKADKKEEKKEEVKSPEASSSARVDTSGDSKGGFSDTFQERLSSVLFRR